MDYTKLYLLFSYSEYLSSSFFTIKDISDLNKFDDDEPEFFAPMGSTRKINLPSENMKRVVNNIKTINEAIDADAIFGSERTLMCAAGQLPTIYITFRINDIILQEHLRKGKK